MITIQGLSSVSISPSYAVRKRQLFLSKFQLVVVLSDCPWTRIYRLWLSWLRFHMITGHLWRSQVLSTLLQLKDLELENEWSLPILSLPFLSYTLGPGPRVTTTMFRALCWCLGAPWLPLFSLGHLQRTLWDKTKWLTVLFKGDH